MIEILQFTLPALIVLIAAWMVMSKLLRNEDARRNFELRRNAQNVVAPIRLRGYERLALLLERVTPEHMLLNISLAGKTAGELQQEMLSLIRAEFDHNLSQQIYVGDEVWMDIISVRENMLTLVNTCVLHVGADKPAIELAQVILSTYSNNGETMIEKAQRSLKAEVKQLY